MDYIPYNKWQRLKKGTRRQIISQARDRISMSYHIDERILNAVNALENHIADLEHEVETLKVKATPAKQKPLTPKQQTIANELANYRHLMQSAAENGYYKEADILLTTVRELEAELKEDATT